MHHLHLDGLYSVQFGMCGLKVWNSMCGGWQYGLRCSLMRSWSHPCIVAAMATDLCFPLLHSRRIMWCSCFSAIAFTMPFATSLAACWKYWLFCKSCWISACRPLCFPLSVFSGFGTLNKSISVSQKSEWWEVVCLLQFVVELRWASVHSYPATRLVGLSLLWLSKCAWLFPSELGSVVHVGCPVLLWSWCVCLGTELWCIPTSVVYWLLLFW